MPEIKIQSVSSCSSEDHRNPSENLLKDGGSHKWKSASPGEKSVSVVLQLSKASQIHSIDIGNEGSAFVEVLVGKEFDSNFEVLLVASSFMTPLESRNGTNKNGVRMFGADKLNNATADKKWDRVKIVCTQPFSKTSSYGLSFIKFHSPPDGKEPETKVQKLGHFTLKTDDDDDDGSFRAGSLFANRSKLAESPKPSVPSGAASIRAAARLADVSPASTSATASVKEAVKRRASSPPKATPSPKARRRDDSDSDTDKATPDPPKPALKKQSTSISSTASSSAGSTRPEKSALKRTKTEPAPTKPLHKLMENVTFVLSGFQNPFRGELRDKACEMGAKYRSDWARGCTHLICAFANTPKYKQVAGKGKIVTKGWILDSNRQKKLLPWRKYRLGDADSPSEDSDDEEITPPPKPKHSREESNSKPKAEKAKVEAPRKPISYDDDSDSGGDTEDELLKAQALSEKKAGKDTKPPEPSTSKSADPDPYGDSTDEDEPSATTSVAASGSNSVGANKGGNGDSDSGFTDLPDFLTDKHFFFYGDFSSAERRLLTRYIFAYNGEVEDYMSKRVKYVITSQKWDDNFDEALTENPDLIFVKPKWIYTCHEKTKLVPYQPHIVV